MDGSEERAVKIDCVYRSFVKQLVHQGAPIPYELSWCLSNESSDQWNSNQWNQILRKLLLEFDNSYIVLDGLDECEEYLQDGIPGIVEFIKQMAKTTRRKVHLVAFSRSLEQLRNAFEDLNATSLTMDDSSVSLDLQTALRYQFSHQPKFARWPVSLKRTIENSLLTQANGSYVYNCGICDHWLTLP